MNKKILRLFVTLVTIAILITPVFAKTKTAVKLELVGNPFPGTEDRLIETPNGKIFRQWGWDGVSVVTLYESDGETIIDTFTGTDDLYSKASDGIVFGFLGGTLVAKLVVFWESGTYEDSGFTGMFQWRGIDGPPHDLKGVFHGFGAYEGQLLKLEGQWISPHHEYDGILIS